MGHGEFVRALRCTMLVGAARADATPAELVGLRDLVAPDSTFRAAVAAGRWDEAEQLVHDVMPPGWEPRPEWRVAD